MQKAQYKLYRLLQGQISMRELQKEPNPQFNKHPLAVDYSTQITLKWKIKPRVNSFHIPSWQVESCELIRILQPNWFQ